MSERFTVTKADEEARIGEFQLDGSRYGSVPNNDGASVHVQGREVYGELNFI